jgi:glycerophosphoryl diester phosphodiesterase
MTLITAHSGCMNTSLNSVEGVWKGINAGADIIEVDIRATKDGIVVLLHDEHISTGSGHYRIQDLTFEELQKLNRQEDLVQLDEVLPIILEHGRIANLDVKEDHAISHMVRTVERFKMRDNVIITGCEKDRAAYLKDHYRAYQVLLNASAALYKSFDRNYDAFVKQTCEDAIAASCCGININYIMCKQTFIDYSARRCLPVMVWTIDDTEIMERFLNMRVHSITSKEIQSLSALRR